MLVILTEGLDEIFIQSLLEHHGYGLGVHFNSESIGGWTKIGATSPKIQEYQDSGATVVLVFDADGDSNGGGFAKRKTEIEDILAIEKIELDTFLFPNNNDDGDYEDLLVSIVNVNRNGVFNCFSQYENCVEKLSTEAIEFKTPIKKSKIFAYLESLPESKKKKNKEIRGGTFFFKKSEYWDLDSPHLQPLMEFLNDKLPEK